MGNYKNKKSIIVSISVSICFTTLVYIYTESNGSTSSEKTQLKRKHTLKHESWLKCFHKYIRID